MTNQEFLTAVETNAARVNYYKLGYDGSKVVEIDGRQVRPCDCIGLDIGAVKLCGEKWNGVHGTNYTVRHMLKDGVSAIGSANDLRPGMLVFKSRNPGEKYYDLPDTYKNDPDQRDYYHVGTVTQVNPLRITHCTSVPGGIKVDTKLGQWKWGGVLKLIKDEEENKEMYMAILTASKGSTVNIRDEKGAFVRRLPIGTEVEVLSVKDGKAYIKYGENKYGYVGSEFLTDVREEPGVGGMQEDKIKRIEALLNEALGLLVELSAAG